MSLFTNFPVSLLAKKTQAPGDIKLQANQIATQAKQTDNPALFTLLSNSDGNLQDQINQIFTTLKKDIPLPKSFGLKDPTGRVIATFGFVADGNAQTYGLTVYDLLNNPADFVGVQTELPQAITATSNASPDVITIAAHGYVNGDTVLVQGSTGDTAINGIGIVEAATTNTFQLTTLGGTPINGNGAYGGGGTAERFYGGGFFQTIGIGGTNGFAGAKIRAFADGSVKIVNATLTIDINGVTTTLGNLPSSNGVVGLEVQNDAPSSQAIEVTDKGFFIIGTDGSTPVVRLLAGSDNGFLRLSNLALTQDIRLDANNPSLQVLNVAGKSFLTPSQLTYTNGSSHTSYDFNQAILQDASGVTQVSLDPIAATVTIGSSANNIVLNGATPTATITGISTQTIIGAGVAVNSYPAPTFGTVIGSTGITGLDTVGAWSISCANGLQIHGNVVVDSATNLSVLSVKVNGTTRITSAGVVTSSNGFTGSQTYVKTVNFGASSVTTGTVTAAAGIVTNMT